MRTLSCYPRSFARHRSRSIVRGSAMTLVMVAIIVGGCTERELATPFRQYTASDAVAVIQQPGTIEVDHPRLVPVREVFGPATTLHTTDVIRFDTPSLCQGCGAIVISFGDSDDLVVARDAIAGVNASHPAPRWTVIEKRNLLVLFDARWPANATNNYAAILCGFDDTCAKE